MQIKNLMSGALTGLLLLAGSMISYATSDPAVLGAIITPAPASYPNNGTMQTFQFQLNNNGTATSNSLVKLTISLAKLDFHDGTFDPTIDMVQTAGTTPFIWSWNPTLKIMTGTLNGNFAQLAGNTFQIRNLVATASSDISNPNIGAQVNITTPGTLNASTANDPTEAFTYSMAPLPVTLVNFNAHKESGCRAGLNWTVNDAVNFSHFEAEQSADGGEYHKVGTIAWEEGKADYSLVTDQPMRNGYYRLKMVDRDNAYQYSEVKTLMLDCAAGSDAVSLYPNPAEKGQSYTLEYNSTTAGKVQYIVTDAVGKVYERRMLEAAVGNNHYMLSTATMAAGTYFVQVLAAGDQNPHALKLIVK